MWALLITINDLVSLLLWKSLKEKMICVTSLLPWCRGVQNAYKKLTQAVIGVVMLYSIQPLIQFLWTYICPHFKNGYKVALLKKKKILILHVFYVSFIITVLMIVSRTDHSKCMSVADIHVLRCADTVNCSYAQLCFLNRFLNVLPFLV